MNLCFWVSKNAFLKSKKYPLKFDTFHFKYMTGIAANFCFIFKWFGTVFAPQRVYWKPSFIYSWSKSHILEHELFGSFGKLKAVRKKKSFWVFLSYFWGCFFNFSWTFVASLLRIRIKSITYMYMIFFCWLKIGYHSGFKSLV